MTSHDHDCPFNDLYWRPDLNNKLVLQLVKSEACSKSNEKWDQQEFKGVLLNRIDDLQWPLSFSVWIIFTMYSEIKRKATHYIISDKLIKLIDGL